MFLTIIILEVIGTRYMSCPQVVSTLFYPIPDNLMQLFFWFVVEFDLLILCSNIPVEKVDVSK